MNLGTFFSVLAGASNPTILQSPAVPQELLLSFFDTAPLVGFLLRTHNIPSVLRTDSSPGLAAKTSLRTFWTESRAGRIPESLKTLEIFLVSRRSLTFAEALPF